jgi:hypothetical protein
VQQRLIGIGVELELAADVGAEDPELREGCTRSARAPMRRSTTFATSGMGSTS